MSKVSARKEGDEARDRRDWAVAATAYRRHLSQNDADAAIWVQLGHALKESLDYASAEQAYRRALTLVPSDADVPLQMGHLMKLLGRRSEAIAQYTASLRLDHRSPARDELYAFGQSATADNIIRTARLSSSQKNSYFQINDLLYFLLSHKTPSGIQRVQLGLIIHALQFDMQKDGVEFVYNRVDDLRIWVIDQKKLSSLIDYLNQVDVEQNILRSKVDDVMSSYIMVHPAKGDTFVILGAFWMLSFNTILLSQIKRRGASIGIYLYDLIPITSPEYCVSQLTTDFTMDLVESLVLIDFAMAISQHTAEEIRKFVSDNNMRPIPIEVVPLAHSLTGTREAESLVDGLSAWSPSTEQLKNQAFVLCVCTIEPRKNHRYLYDIWKALKLRGVEVPKLVFVGRRGWNMNDFFLQMENSDYLDGDIVVVHDLSDMELATLYENCYFTAFPSIVEGWGLPVGESLFYGKLCVSSNASSMPEVGGDLVQYIDPWNVRSGIEIFRDLIQNPEKVRHWEKRICAEFQPRGWEAVSAEFYEAAARLAKMTPATAFSVPATRPGHIIEVGRFARGPLRIDLDEMLCLERLAFGDDFYAPEPFGAWMKGAEGRIHVSTRLPPASKIFVFLELTGAPSIINLQVDVSGVKSKSRIATVSEHKTTLIKVETQVDDEGIALINLKIIDDFDKERYLPRIFAIALRSFAYAKDDDVIARVNVVESYMFDSRAI